MTINLHYLVWVPLIVFVWALIITLAYDTLDKNIMLKHLKIEIITCFIVETIVLSLLVITATTGKYCSIEKPHELKYIGAGEETVNAGRGGRYDNRTLDFITKDGISGCENYEYKQDLYKYVRENNDQYSDSMVEVKYGHEIELPGIKLTTLSTDFHNYFFVDKDTYNAISNYVEKEY